MVPCQDAPCTKMHVHHTCALPLDGHCADVDCLFVSSKCCIEIPQRAPICSSVGRKRRRRLPLSQAVGALQTACAGDLGDPQLEVQPWDQQ